MKLILSSQNQGKVQEILAYAKNIGVDVSISPIILDPKEIGSTFIQNSLIKASAYYEKLKIPILSDDSGLCLDAFPEIMGVETSNYKSELKSYDEKCEALLKMYVDAEEKNRKAMFICNLCLYISDKEFYFFEGVMRGAISFEARGSKGFGYDPIFIPEGENFTLAEDEKWKSIHSHRAKAVKSLCDFLSNRSGKIIQSL